MGVKFIHVSIVYFVIGVILGMAMSMSGDHTLTGVHAHVNLLGWVSGALAGVVYWLFPQAGGSLMAKIHFWAYNIALPVMMIGLTLLLLGHDQYEPAVAAGGSVVVLSVILFAINVLVHVRSAASASAQKAKGKSS